MSPIVPLSLTRNMALQASLGKLLKYQQLRNVSEHFSSTASIAHDSQQFPDYVLRAPTTDVTTLDSGLRVASESVVGSETATVGV